MCRVGPKHFCLTWLSSLPPTGEGQSQEINSPGPVMCAAMGWQSQAFPVQLGAGKQEARLLSCPFSFLGFLSPL